MRSHVSLSIDTRMMVGINSAGCFHLVFAAVGRQRVRELSTLNCVENVGRRVWLRQPTLRTVSADRRADRR